MKKEHAIKWINALRSGKYKQGNIGQLKDENGGYCCLGVLNQIFPEFNLDSGDYYSSTLLPSYEKIGLLTETGRLINSAYSLSNFNDGTYCSLGRFTFDEIADIIQIEYVEGL